MQYTKNIFLTIVASTFFLGCQSSPPIKESRLDNGSFMSLWNIYSQCNSSNDLEEMNKDAVILEAAAKRSYRKNVFVFPLPGKLEQLVTSPSTRLSVDVKAMSASCSLRAGQAAFEASRLDLARELLQAIFAYRPESEYTFYILQAKAILSEIDPASIQVSLELP